MAQHATTRTTLSATTEESAVLAGRQRTTALVVLCIGMLMMVLDATIVNVALPTIQADLGFTQAGLAWVVNGYLIAFGGLLLLAGRLGDLGGRRSVFLTGIVLFCVASLLCGLATGPSMLVGARFLQGIGSALTSSVILGMIVTMYPEPAEQARAISVFSFTASAGGSLGLFAGGVITQTVSWHWVFFVNIPIGVITVVAALRFVPRDRGIGWGDGVDVLGAVLITGAVMLTVFTIVSPATERGWGDPLTLLLLASALLLFGLFVLREATCDNPIVPLAIFREPNVAAANVVQIFNVAGIFGIFFLGVLYFQNILGYDALQIGLAYLPCTLLIATMSFKFTDKLAIRFGARRTLLAGLSLLAVGEAMFARSDAASSYPAYLLPSMLVIGIGIGLGVPSLTILAMSSARPDDAGLASGLVNTTLQVGAAIGLAVLASISASRTHRLLDAGGTRAHALLGGFHLAFAVGTGLILTALLVAALAVRRVELAED